MDKEKEEKKIEDAKGKDVVHKKEEIREDFPAEIKKIIPNNLQMLNIIDVLLPKERLDGTARKLKETIVRRTILDTIGLLARLRKKLIIEENDNKCKKNDFVRR